MPKKPLATKVSRPAKTKAQGAATPAVTPRKQPPHCNQLDGKHWLQNSISVWSDIRKTTEETRLRHPAMFPSALVERLIQTFLPPTGQVVLDPFAGSGSTLVAAKRLGKQGIGIELSPEYAELARSRLEGIHLSGPLAQAIQDLAPTGQNGSIAPPPLPVAVIHQASARDLLKFVAPESVDLCVSSPPYWNILNQRRTADLKSIRHYGNLADDVGTVEDYQEFLNVVTEIFTDVLTVLKPRAYCCVVVMDLRKQDRFFPLHSDLATRLSAAGYRYDDLIIWNRQTEYNNLRPLGYPSVFRVNKVHEYILLMQKPAASA